MTENRVMFRWKYNVSSTITPACKFTNSRYRNFFCDLKVDRYCDFVSFNISHNLGYLCLKHVPHFTAISKAYIELGFSIECPLAGSMCKLKHLIEATSFRWPHSSANRWTNLSYVEIIFPFNLPPSHERAAGDGPRKKKLFNLEQLQLGSAWMGHN